MENINNDKVEKIKEQLEVIIDRCLLSGEMDITVANDLGVSRTYLGGLRRAYTMIKRKSPETVLEWYKNGAITIEAVVAIYESLPAAIPQEYIEINNQRYKERCEAAKRGWETKKANFAPVAQISNTQTAKPDNNCPLWEQQKLMLLREINESLKTLMDVVIPTHKEDIMKQINANADSIGLQFSDAIKYLDNIRGNTKRIKNQNYN